MSAPFWRIGLAIDCYLQQEVTPTLLLIGSGVQNSTGRGRLTISFS